MSYELTLRRRGASVHEFTVRFEDVDEVVTILATPLLALMRDVLASGADGSWSPSASRSSASATRGPNSIEELHPGLARRRFERLWLFRPPLELMPIDELYQLAAALDQTPISAGERPAALAPLVLLLASAQLGKDVADLAAYTELPEHQVEEYGRRLWENGVWIAGEPYWPRLASPTVLIKDALVAEGLVVRADHDHWVAAEVAQ